ncbi:amidase, partial [filamentous cyanobacterium CCP5]
LCAIAQGSDGAGSLRGPAFLTGLYTIKGSRGRVSFAPVGERLEGMAINGPLGRTVADTAALLDAISGYVTGDPYWLPEPESGFVAHVRSPAAPLRIGYTTQIPPIGAAAPVCAQAVTDTVQRLADLGHSVEAFELPDLANLIEPFVSVWQSIVVESGVPWFVMEKMNRWLYWRARFVHSGHYLRQVSKLQQEARKIVASCQPYDAVVLPVYMHPAIQVGEWKQLRPKPTLEKLINWVAPCPPFSASGQPAMAIPTGLDGNGVPIGVQLVGRPADETTLFALAAQLEKAYPWQGRPPLAVG